MTVETVGDLRQRLVAIGMKVEDAKAIKGKRKLKDKLEALTKADNQMKSGAYMSENEDPYGDGEGVGFAAPCDEDEMEGLVSMIDEEATEQQTEEADPLPGSEEWHKFIMGQFRKGELKEIDGGAYPTVWGLRRVVGEFAGEIISNESTLSHLVEVCGVLIASASCKIEICKQDGSTCTYSDVADCHKHNTPQPYSRHPTSTAATKAESRTLKKILCLHSMTAEEAIVGDEEDFLPTAVTDTQLRAIGHLCSNLDIDVLKLLSAVSEKTITNVSQLNHSLASETMATLNNEYGGDKQKVPHNITGYKGDWNEG